MAVKRRRLAGFAGTWWCIQSLRDFPPDFFGCIALCNFVLDDIYHIVTHGFRAFYIFFFLFGHNGKATGGTFWKSLFRTQRFQAESLEMILLGIIEIISDFLLKFL